MTAPFLTDLDPEIAVKGSMDPLGFMPLWSRYGRRVVNNLSLVASSARGFTTLMLGYHFARRAIDERELPDARFIDAFLTFEQLAAYSRVATTPEDAPTIGRIIGLRRVRNRLRENTRVPIGPTRDAQIMSNQKAYGLWALFSAPAELSGIVDRRAMKLTDDVDRFVTQTVYPRLQKAGFRDGREVLNLLAPSLTPKTFDPAGRHRELARVLADLHSPTFRAEERDFYLERFACGGPSDPDGLQHALWELVRDHNDAKAQWPDRFAMTELVALIDAADRSGHPELADRLQQILRFEHVIGPAASLFGYLQVRGDDRTVAEVSKDLSAAWGTGLAHVDPDAVARHLEPVEELHGEDGRRRFEQLAAALRDGEWPIVLDLVLAQNADVAERRGGGRWIVLEGDRFAVRYRQEGGELPTRPRELLVHPYYLTSMKSLGGQVLGRDVAQDDSEA
jgi:hypothetical protein